MAMPAKTGGAAVESWYSEIKDYDFNAGRGRGTGHFTQVITAASDTQDRRTATPGRRIGLLAKTLTPVTPYIWTPCLPVLLILYCGCSFPCSIHALNDLNLCASCCLTHCMPFDLLHAA